MSLINKNYDAFISYRHADLDKFVAETLHKELESFRLPKNMVKKLSENNSGKTRINRVFRDRDELPIASNLADPITNALQNSEFLIVICSPRLLESVWCKKEIEAFIGMHGREHVLAVLIEGEPDDSFPDIIRFVETIEKQADGTEVKTHKSVEPLAADVRGDNKKEIRKKIKEEVLRLAAPMFQCGYDDLRQRHREQRLKRIVAVALSAGVVCLSFGTVSTAMALRINSQSKEIKEQSKEIEEQYKQALLVNSKSLAEDSLRSLETGDRIGAIETAKTALPDTLQKAEIPYTPQAQYALTESLLVYQNNTKILPLHILQQDAKVNFTELSPQGDLLLVADQYGKIYVWDALNRKKIMEMEAGRYNMLPEEVEFLGNDCIVYLKEDGFGVFDFIKQEEVFAEDTGDGFSVVCSKDGTYFSIAESDGITVYEAGTFEKKYHKEASAGKRIASTASFEEGGSYFAYTETAGSDTPERETHIQLVNLAAGEAEKKYAMAEESIEQISFCGRELYIAANESISFGEKSIEQLGGRIVCFEIDGSESSKWSYQPTKKYITDFKITGGPSQDLILFCSYDTLGVLDRSTGNFVDEVKYARKVVNYAPLKETDSIVVVTRDSQFHYLNARTLSDLEIVGKFKSTSDNLKEFGFADGFYVSLAYDDTFVTIQTLAKGNAVTPVYKGDTTINEVIVNDEETQMAFVENGSESQKVTTFDLKTDKKNTSITMDGMIEGFTYLDRQTIGVAANNKISHYDSYTGELKKEIKLGDAYLTYGGINHIKKIVYFNTHQSILVFDMDTGELLHEMQRPDDLKEAGVYSIGNQSEIYAVASKGQKRLELCRIGETKSYLEIPINAACIDFLYFDQEDKNIYVTFLDGKVEMYQTADLSLVRTYSFSEKVKKVVSLEKGITLLLADNEGYVLDGNQDVVAKVNNLQEILKDTKEYIIIGGTIIYKVPVYDYKMLMKEAERQLN